MTNVRFKFENLEIWQLGMAFARSIYNASRKFPKIEQYGLTSQIRRAATSIPLNIAEGCGRRTKKDFANFLRNGIGSCLEVITCLKIALQENYLSPTTYDKLIQGGQEIYFKLIAFEKTLLV